MQEAYLVVAGLVGLGYFYFWLQGYGPASGEYPSSAANACNGTANDVHPMTWMDVSEIATTSDALALMEPDCNTDGTPMAGDLDIDSNPYGVTQIGSDPCEGGVSGLSATEDTWSNEMSTSYTDTCSPFNLWAHLD